MEEKYCTE